MFKNLVGLLGVSVFAASSLFACSGEDDGNDEDFVRGLCEASTELRNGVEQAIKDSSSSTDPNKAVESLAEPVDEFADDFGDLDPPQDLVDWHDDASDTLTAVAKDFRERKDIAALEGFNDSPVPDPPSAAKARLREAAEDIQECNGVTFFKPD
jgi:hypothetical protein